MIATQSPTLRTLSVPETHFWHYSSRTLPTVPLSQNTPQLLLHQTRRCQPNEHLGTPRPADPPNAPQRQRFPYKILQCQEGTYLILPSARRACVYAWILSDSWQILVWTSTFPTNDILPPKHPEGSMAIIFSFLFFFFCLVRLHILHGTFAIRRHHLWHTNKASSLPFLYPAGHIFLVPHSLDNMAIFSGNLAYLQGV